MARKSALPPDTIDRRKSEVGAIDHCREQVLGWCSSKGNTNSKFFPGRAVYLKALFLSSESLLDVLLNVCPFHVRS